ncbi:MAG: hypothetical protein Q4E88_06485 [Coriobacteriia bacterium]|nr:hypothetical protein [Coriobacteriia bacterium]
MNKKLEKVNTKELDNVFGGEGTNGMITIRCKKCHFTTTVSVEKARELFFSPKPHCSSDDGRQRAGKWEIVDDSK